MTIKQLLFAAATICSLTSASVLADDNSWWRDGDDYYKGLVDSSDGGFQAVIRPRSLKNEAPYVGFQLVTSHKTYCSDKGDSFHGNLTLAVNDRKVAFNTTCYNNEWLNVFPASVKSNMYIMKEFNYQRNKFVTFVMPINDSPDWVFNFPTKGFGKIYSSIDESIKEPIQ